jgi:hypothetical protein
MENNEEQKYDRPLQADRRSASRLDLDRRLWKNQTYGHACVVDGHAASTDSDGHGNSNTYVHRDAHRYRDLYAHPYRDADVNTDVNTDANGAASYRSRQPAPGAPQHASPPGRRALWRG